jgi:hypothetical protein
MGATNLRHTSDHLALDQVDLDGVVHVGKGGVQVRQMVTSFIQTWVAVEDGPVLLIEGAEHLAQDLLRGWCWHDNAPCAALVACQELVTATNLSGFLTMLQLYGILTIMSRGKGSTDHDKAIDTL